MGPVDHSVTLLGEEEGQLGHACACFWAPECPFDFFEWLAGVFRQREGRLHLKVRPGRWARPRGCTISASEPAVQSLRLAAAPCFAAAQCPQAALPGLGAPGCLLWELAAGCLARRNPARTQCEGAPLLTSAADPPSRGPATPARLQAFHEGPPKMMNRPHKLDSQLNCELSGVHGEAAWSNGMSASRGAPTRPSSRHARRRLRSCRHAGQRRQAGPHMSSALSGSAPRTPSAIPAHLQRARTWLGMGLRRTTGGCA